jgi:uncharacterized protein YndB with AHSA1/START domain
MAIKLEFEKKITAEPKQIFFALSNKNGLRDWLADIVEFNEAGKSVFGTFIEKTENERILFEVLTAEKHRRYDIEVQLTEEDENTLLKIEVMGVQAEEQDKIESFFENALANLRSVIEDGIDNRVYKKPMLGVNIGELINPENAKTKNYPIDHGFVIPGVIDGLGAKKAGILPGDIMAEFDGKKITSFDVLSGLAAAKIGDVFNAVVYRGSERKEIAITLSHLPLPKLPASAQDAADTLKKIYQKMEDKLDQVLDGVSENAAEYRPAPGEWNVKEVYAHMILASRDIFNWAASLIAGREEYVDTSTIPEKIKSVITSHASLHELRAELDKVQKENVAFLSEISVEFTSRKNSFMRLSENTKKEHMHYKDHVEQIKNNLKQAKNI